MKHVLYLTLTTLLLGGCATSSEDRGGQPVPPQDEQPENPFYLGQQDPDRQPIELRPGDTDLGSLDRTHWQTIHVAPEPGTMRHRPAYLSRPRQGQDVSLNQASVEARFDAALSGSRPAGYGQGQALDVVAEPARFLFDVVTLPAAMILNPPRVSAH